MLLVEYLNVLQFSVQFFPHLTISQKQVVILILENWIIRWYNELVKWFLDLTQELDVSFIVQIVPLLLNDPLVLQLLGLFLWIFPVWGVWESLGSCAWAIFVLVENYFFLKLDLFSLMLVLKAFIISYLASKTDYHHIIHG